MYSSLTRLHGTKPSVCLACTKYNNVTVETCREFSLECAIPLGCIEIYREFQLIVQLSGLQIYSFINVTPLIVSQSCFFGRKTQNQTSTKKCLANSSLFTHPAFTVELGITIDVQNPIDSEGLIWFDSISNSIKFGFIFYYSGNSLSLSVVKIDHLILILLAQHYQY